MLAILGGAGVSPADIDAALDARIGEGHSAVLRPRHPLVAQVRETTRLEVVQIARRSRYLLIAIEQKEAHGAAWQYHEHTARHCMLTCPGTIPITAAVALSGLPLEQLVLLPPALAGMKIKQIADAGDAWLEVEVAPHWCMF